MEKIFLFEKFNERNIQNKITSLLNKTVKRGATEEEEKTSKSKALELIKKYKIPLSILDIDANLKKELSKYLSDYDIDKPISEYTIEDKENYIELNNKLIEESGDKIYNILKKYNSLKGHLWDLNIISEYEKYGYENLSDWKYETSYSGNDIILNFRFKISFINSINSLSKIFSDLNEFKHYLKNKINSFNIDINFDNNIIDGQTILVLNMSISFEDFVNDKIFKEIKNIG